MKKMKLLTIFFFATFAVACGQKADDTFLKPMYFNFGLSTTKITFPDGTSMNTALTGGTTYWSDVLSKPLLFPPIAHTHDYDIDLTNKPGTIQLQEAISQMPGIDFPVLTQAEINALVLPIKKGKIVINSTANAMQWYDGLTWKIFPTTN